MSTGTSNNLEWEWNFEPETGIWTYTFRPYIFEHQLEMFHEITCPYCGQKFWIENEKSN